MNIKKRLRYSLQRLCLAFVFLTLAVSAYADLPLSAGDGYAEAYEVPTLIRLPIVYDELNVSDETRKQLQQISTQYRAEVRDVFEEMPDEHAEVQAKVNEFKERVWDRVRETLTVTQFQRLKQLSWQVAGGLALYDPEVSDAIELTEAQLEELTAIEKTLKPTTHVEVPGNRKTRGRRAQRASKEFLEAQYRKAKAERDARLLAILTPGQKQRFDELLGSPWNP